jgi:hypothetical protein
MSGTVCKQGPPLYRRRQVKLVETAKWETQTESVAAAED